MTREEALVKLTKLHADSADTERDHWDADDILCDLLRALGYDDVVEAWDKIDKWYS
jgi:hypothetical protein